MVYVMLLLNIVLLVAGQIVWKFGLQRAGGLHFDNVAQVVISPLILLGILFYGAATFLWLYVLSRLPLSVAYPLQSFAYVAGLLVAVLLFKENLPPNRWVGALVIMGGIAVLSWK